MSGGDDEAGPPWFVMDLDRAAEQARRDHGEKERRLNIGKRKKAKRRKESDRRHARRKARS